jgi:hypothetical protein
MRVTRKAIWLSALLPAVLSGGCSQEAPGSSIYVLTFQEKDMGMQEFTTTRMIVTTRYLRIDDGVDDNNFVLFDRESRKVYSVSQDQRTILRIDPAPVTLEPPTTFTHTTEALELTDSPAVAGQPVKGYRLLTNGEVCYELAVVEEILDGPRAALREYETALSGEHAAVTAYTPPDLQSDCSLANYVFLPGRELEHGFPIRMQDATGRVRILTNYQAGYEPTPGVFDLPKGYREFSPAEMRGTAQSG